MTQNSPKLTVEQIDVLNGILLGDASLKTQTVGSYALRIEQGSVGSERSPDKSLYVEHLYGIFSSLVNPNTPPAVATAELGTKLGFTTMVQPCLLYYGKRFYRKATDEEKRLHQLTGAKNELLYKKIVPEDIREHLTDRALAYWYMDDGSLKGSNRSGKTLSTHGFTEKEVELLVAALRSRGIGANLNTETLKRNNKTYYKIYITAAGDKELTKRIRPYVLPIFLYKLDQSAYAERKKNWQAFDKKQADLLREQMQKAKIDQQEKT